MTTSTTAFAAWHPSKGFGVPNLYEGPIAFVHVDDVIKLVKDLNKADGTNNRTGWRVVKVKIEGDLT